MRLLADESVAGAVVRELRAAGHDVEYIRDDARGISDPDVLARARRTQRTLLTFDRDFGDLIFRDSLLPPRGVVLARLTDPDPQQLATRLVQVLIEDPAVSRSFLVVQQDQVRRRPLPGQGRS